MKIRHTTRWFGAGFGFGVWTNRFHYDQRIWTISIGFVTIHLSVSDE